MAIETPNQAGGTLAWLRAGRRRLASSVVLVVALVWPAAGGAQTGGPVVARVAAGQAVDEAGASALARWRQQVQGAGTIRLIASLSSPPSAAGVTGETARAASGAALAQVVARLGARARAARALTMLPVLVVEIDAEGLEALLTDPAIAALEEDRTFVRALAQSVPLVQADQVWAQGYRGAGWTVAILDDGVEATHPAFGGRVVAEACYSGHGSTAASQCPGKVLSSTAPGSAAPCSGCTHGTHVAGIAAGSTGVAPLASIIAMQVFSRDDLAYFTDVLQAIDRVLVLASTYDIAAVNLSLGTESTYAMTCDAASPAVFTAFAALRTAGIAPVVSSGNTSTSTGLEFPACFSNAVSVGSTSKADVVESYSNAASFLQLLAPGGAITAPVPGGGTAVKSGTSMAAPHVTGAWALLRERLPTASVDIVLSALRTTGLPVTDARNGLTFPRLRIAAAAETLASFAVTPTSWAAAAGGDTTSVALSSSAASATWTTSTSQAWLTVAPTGGIGSATVTMMAAPHTTSALARAATATIGGRTIIVTQGGATAQFTWASPAPALAHSGETRTSLLTSSLPDAAWTASSSQAWLTVSPLAGIGSTVLTLTALPHTSSAAPRTAFVTVGGQALPVLQGGAPAAITVSPATWSPPVSGGTQVVGVAVMPADGAWDVTPSASWVSAMPASGVGAATVTLVASAHTTSALPRTATVSIGGQAVVVTQAGAVPQVTVAPTRVEVPSTGDAYPLTVTSSLPDNAWSITSSATWLTAQVQAGTGTGSVLVRAAANVSVHARTGTVTLAGYLVTFVQAGVVPGFSVDPTTLSLEAPGGTRLVALTASAPDASWSVASTVPWLTVSPSSGQGSATIAVVVAPTSPTQPRTGTFTVAGRVVTVVQAGGDPSATVSAVSWQPPSEGASTQMLLDVTASTGSWIAISNVPWLTVSPAHGTGDMPVTLAALPSASSGAGLPTGVLPSPLPTTSAVVTVSQAAATGLRTGLVVFLPQPPVSMHSRFLAEGAASGFFDTRLALLNAGDIDTSATVTFLRSGHDPVDLSVDVPALTRRTIWPGTIPTLADAEFSTIVTASQPLVVDRTMTWGPSGYGAHAETAAMQPSPRWYFAEGATHSGFALFYLLQNPDARSVDVRVRYLRATEPPLEKTYTLAPRSRTNIWVNLEQFPGLGQALAAAEVSAVVETLDGTPIIAERAMYRSSGGRPFDAGHESMGVTTPSTRWFFAEGRTGAFFDQFILIANPSDMDAAVRVTYLLDDGRTYVTTMVAPASARTSLWVDRTIVPGVAGEPLADVALSMVVESINGVPLITERAMWWPGDGTTWHEAHGSAGATTTGTVWALAEGEVGGPRARQTYVLIANASAFAGRARVTLLFEDGTSASTVYALAAQSRTNAAIGPDIGEVADGRRFGVLVEALGATDGAEPPQIVVERAMYWDADGTALAAGTSALATRLR